MDCIVKAIDNIRIGLCSSISNK